MIYTTNSIESLNARFRRATRVRGHFPNEAAALKVLDLTIRTLDSRGGNVVGRVRNWKQVLTLSFFITATESVSEVNDHVRLHKESASL